MRWVVLALCVSGCASGTFERVPGQDDAERIVWNELLGMEGAAPPVEWIDINDGWIGGEYGGATIIGSRVQVIYWPTDPGNISSTEFAHELIHYSCFVRTGDVDPLHFRADWSIEDKARARLIEAGH